MTNDARFVYVTTSNRDEALSIGRALVAERLAACANVTADVTSIYHWEGAIQEDTEAVLILKSRAPLIGKLTERVKAMHSYTCPCVVALAIDDGNTEYLDWITAETADLGEPAR